MPIRDLIDIEALPYALGAIGLGAVTMLVGDFAMQWQPVPRWLPAYEPLAHLSGALLVAGGVTAAMRRGGDERLILPLFYLLWAVALHPLFIAAAPSIGTLLGLAEILALAAGGSMLTNASKPRYNAASGVSRLGGSMLTNASTPRWLRPAARIAFGISALVFGLAHFVYADFTAKMVPGWLPVPHFWTYATGLGHIAAGIAILSGIKARLAATALAAMCGSFVLLLHAPRVAANPGSRLEWTMMFVALSLAGAALLIRRALPR